MAAEWPPETLSPALYERPILRPGENGRSGPDGTPRIMALNRPGGREKSGLASGCVGEAQRRLAKIGRRHVVDQLDDALLPSLPDFQEIRIVFTQVRPQFRLK
jgi:hypothetical protein